MAGGDLIVGGHEIWMLMTELLAEALEEAAHVVEGVDARQRYQDVDAGLPRRLREGAQPVALELIAHQERDLRGHLPPLRRLDLVWRVEIHHRPIGHVRLVDL